MPPRIRAPSRSVLSHLRRTPTYTSHSYATAAAIATTPAPSHQQIHGSNPPIARYPSTQPPSLKPAEFRKTQLLRQYASLIRSTPLMILFQHNNLKSNEWVSIRRELSLALQKVDAELAASSTVPYAPLAEGIKIQIIQTGIFEAALKIVEHYDPTKVPEGSLKHTLSKTAYEAISQQKKAKSALDPLLSGPLALLNFPVVSPQHLKAALTVLAPQKPLYPAPTRRANPGWHDPSVQGGLQKLLMMGARVEGKVFDQDGVRWVGSIDGGIDGLRAQLVQLLGGSAAQLTQVLESAGKSLYFTVEGRRSMLEDEAKEKA